MAVAPTVTVEVEIDANSMADKLDLLAESYEGIARGLRQSAAKLRSKKANDEKARVADIIAPPYHDGHHTDGA